MRLSLLSLLLMFTFLHTAIAQKTSTPRFEAFGGYSLLQTPAGNSTQHGWNSAASMNLNRWFAVTADISGVYFDERFFYPAGGGFPDRTLHAYGSGYHFLCGPTISLRRPRYTLFAHTLFGVGHGTQHNTLSVPGGSTTFKATDTPFSAALGGGFDISLSKNVAFRPAQADYVVDRIRGYNSNRFRYSTGFVFRFGY